MRGAARLLMALITAVTVAGCGSKPIVGILLPTSGAASTYGESMKKAIEMAIEEARANTAPAEDDVVLPPGFVAVWADSASDPEVAATEFRRLVDEGAVLVVAGTTSAEAKALLPVIEETQTLCLSPSASLPALTKDSRLFFRVFTSDELEGRKAGQFLRKNQDKNTVLIYTGDSEQARGIEPPFRQVFEQALGGHVVGRVIIGSPDWEKESADLLAAESPGAVYVVAYADKTIEALKHLREKGYKGTICASSAFYSGEVVEQYRDLVEGVYFPQPAFDVRDDRAEVKRFVTGFRARYHQDPDIYAAHAYDAMRVVLKAIDESERLDPNELRKALLFGIKEFPGVTGIIQFNDYGDVHHNPIMFIIRDGEVRNYERYLDEEKARIREKIKDLLNKA